MAKGQKFCPFCDGIIKGCRTRVCSHCHKELIPSKPYDKANSKLAKIAENKGLALPKIAEKFDWQTLERGDIIKVSQMGGPVWKLDTGEEVSMGYSGNFKVLSKDSKGIHALGLGKRSGHHYINFVEEESKSGIVRRPHNILKVKKHVFEEPIG